MPAKKSTAPRRVRQKIGTLTRAQKDAVFDEKQRLRHQLHDGLFQDIAAIVFLVQFLRRKLEKSRSQDPEAIKITERIWEAANRCVTTMKGVASDLETPEAKGKN